MAEKAIPAPHAVVNEVTRTVENVVLIAEGDGSKPDKGYRFVASATAAIGDTWEGEATFTRPPAPEPAPLTAEEIDARRQAAYAAEADPLYFKAERGEATKQDWLDKIAEIKARIPKDEE